MLNLRRMKQLLLLGFAMRICKEKLVSSPVLSEWSRTEQAESTCKKRMRKYSTDDPDFSLCAALLLV